MTDYTFFVSLKLHTCYFNEEHRTFLNKSKKGLPWRLDLSTRVIKEINKPLMDQSRLITLGRGVGRVWEFNSFQGERGGGEISRR